MSINVSLVQFSTTCYKIKTLQTYLNCSNK